MTATQVRESIIRSLQQPGCPESLSPDNLDKLFQAILPVFRKHIDDRVRSIVHATIIPGTDTTLPRRANTLKAEEYLKSALGTYLFTTKKWKTKVPLIPYLLRTLSNFSAIEFNQSSFYPKINRFACPACKEMYLKEPLVEMSEGVLHCKSCNDYLSVYNHLDDPSLKKRLRLANMFVKHSKKGVKCPRCGRFVPFSLVGEDGVLRCPYETCGVECSDAEKVNHPIGSFRLDMRSLDDALRPWEKSDKRKITLGDSLKDKKLKSVDVSLEQMDSIKKTVASVTDIIKSQKAVNGKTRGSPNKSVMYDSILNVIDKYPFEMVSFLVKRNKADLPMQALIFQEFSRNMLDILPVEFMCNNKPVKIDSPLDPKLKLFTGIRSFVGAIDKGLSIKKPTTLLKNREEDFVASEPSTQYSFMGSIRRIIDEDGEDLMQDIDAYSFVNVKFKPSPRIVPGKKAYVEYYSIPSHYSMQSMAHLRRIMKRIHHSCAAKKL